MNKFIICILSFCSYLFFACKQNAENLPQIHYFTIVTSHQEELVYIDSVFENKVLRIEKRVLLNKNTIDSLIKCTIPDSVLEGDMKIYYNDSFQRIFEGNNLSVFKLKIFNIKEGYGSTILYNPVYGVMVKNYHGHGRVYLDSIVFGNGYEGKNFSIFTRKLMMDSLIFKKMPVPPPPPPTSVSL